MLQKIRDRATGWFAWLILLMISVPFALWGINHYFEDGGTANIATVNDVDIGRQEYERAMQDERARLQRMLGAGFNPAMLESPEWKRAVADRLIDTEVLRQAALDRGLQISDAQLRAYIQSMEVFQQDGKFLPETYERMLRTQGMSAASFEQRMRTSLLLSQFQNAVTDSAIATDADVDRMVRLARQARDIAYVRFPVTQYQDPASVDDAAVAEYFDRNSEQFQIPEKITVDYLELDTAKLAQAVAVDEAALKKMYEEQLAQFGVEERRHARHILIQVAEDADQAAVDAAKAKLAQAQAALAKGDGFEAVAKKYSEDAGSSAQGGDLGFFGKGVMDPTFEAAVYALKAGEISEPVRTPYGLHLIQLVEIQAAKQKQFDEVRAELEQQYRQRDAERRYYDLAGTLTDASYEHPDSLAPAAQLLDLPVKSSEPFDRDAGTGIAADPKIRAAAFAEDVLAQGYNSAPIELSPTHVVVLRLKERTPPVQQKLEDVRATIVERIVVERARAAAEAAGKSALERLRQGEDAAMVAADNKVKHEPLGMVRRDDRTHDAAILQAAFRLPRPAQGQAVHDGIALASGDYVVVSVRDVKDGDPAQLSKDERLAAVRQLRQIGGSAAFTAVRQTLREEAKIKVYDTVQD